MGLFLCWGSVQEINLLQMRQHLLMLFVECSVFSNCYKEIIEGTGYFFVSFNFSSFTSNVGNLYHRMYFLCLFLYNIPCCFYSVTRFYYMEPVPLTVVSLSLSL
jgi:hypothetical protein